MDGSPPKKEDEEEKKRRAGKTGAIKKKGRKKDSKGTPKKSKPVGIPKSSELQEVSGMFEEGSPQIGNVSNLGERRSQSLPSGESQPSTSRGVERIQQSGRKRALPSPLQIEYDLIRRRRQAEQKDSSQLGPLTCEIPDDNPVDNPPDGPPTPEPMRGDYGCNVIIVHSPLKQQLNPSRAASHTPPKFELFVPPRDSRCNQCQQSNETYAKLPNCPFCANLSSGQRGSRCENLTGEGASNVGGDSERVDYLSHLVSRVGLLGQTDSPQSGMEVEPNPSEAFQSQAESQPHQLAPLDQAEDQFGQQEDVSGGAGIAGATSERQTDIDTDAPQTASQLYSSPEYAEVLYGDPNMGTTNTSSDEN